MQGTNKQFVSNYLAESLAVMDAVATGETFADTLGEIAKALTNAFQNGNKLLIAGNGGSAADAQHIAGEFVSRLMVDRAPLPAIALTTDTTVLTAIANDYGYDYVFERQLQALGHPGDVFLGISTSGKSPNVLRALVTARSRGIVTVGFTGSQGGPMLEQCDVLLAAPSPNTAIIQQVHITAAHTVCALVERAIFPMKVVTVHI